MLLTGGGLIAELGLGLGLAAATSEKARLSLVPFEREACNMAPVPRRRAVVDNVVAATRLSIMVIYCFLPYNVVDDFQKFCEPTEVVR